VELYQYTDDSVDMLLLYATEETNLYLFSAGNKIWRQPLLSYYWT